MLERFTGGERYSYLVEALGNQSALSGVAGLIEEICDHIDILGFGRGEMIIEEGAPSNDLYFILSGTVSIRVYDREIAVRTPGQHIGEMAALDPGQRRSASAVADNEVVVGRVDAMVLNRIAESFPHLWRNIAQELSARLRQRNHYVSPMNPRPVLFVGCSTEALSIARAIQTALYYDPIIVKLWTNGVFDIGSYPLESLQYQLNSVDFAALVLSPDDSVISRATSTEAPRDNVVFELGLFMGTLSRSRTFLLVPRDFDIKVPTDVIGITPLTYESDLELDTAAAVAVACNELRDRILMTGPR